MKTKTLITTGWLLVATAGSAKIVSQVYQEAGPYTAIALAVFLVIHILHWVTEASNIKAISSEYS